jgi:hypothetical protein
MRVIESDVIFLVLKNSILIQLYGFFFTNGKLSCLKRNFKLPNNLGVNKIFKVIREKGHKWTIFALLEVFMKIFDFNEIGKMVV